MYGSVLLPLLSYVTQFLVVGMLSHETVKCLWTLWMIVVVPGRWRYRFGIPRYGLVQHCCISLQTSLVVSDLRKNSAINPLS